MNNFSNFGASPFQTNVGTTQQHPGSFKSWVNRNVDVTFNESFASNRGCNVVSSTNSFVSNNQFAKNNTLLGAPAVNYNTEKRVENQAAINKEVVSPEEPRAVVKGINGNPISKVRFLTGSTEKTIQLNKIEKDYFCYYEVISSIIGIQDGALSIQKILLLRDKNKGPVLQVLHYQHDHIDITDFHIGQMLRCVGRMIGPNIMHSIKIREATKGEVVTLQRMCFVSDHALQKK